MKLEVGYTNDDFILNQHRAILSHNGYYQPLICKYKEGFNKELLERYWFKQIERHTWGLFIKAISNPLTEGQKIQLPQIQLRPL